MTEQYQTPCINVACNDGTDDVLGGMSIFAPANAVTTVVGAPGAYVPIGTGNPGTHPLYVPSASGLFNLAVVGATAPSQQLQYTGPGAMRGSLALNASAHTTFFASEDISIRAFQNGVPILESTTSGETFGSFLGNLSGAVPVVASPGDVFDIRIANLSSGLSLLVDVVNLTIQGDIDV